MVMGCRQRLSTALNGDKNRGRQEIIGEAAFGIPKKGNFYQQYFPGKNGK
jgi:hypothetical protein